MMSFLETLEKLFNTRDLYQVLSLDKSASESEIKRAYRRKSLEVHPDRVPRAEKVVATEKFQALSRVHSILSDQDKKAVYDDSGEVEDDIVVQERDWDAYWRILFKKITVEDIREFEASYKGSEEEENDLKSAYIDYEGDMDAIMENVLCATVEDEPRYREIIQRLVDAKEIPKYKKFTNEEKRKKKARKQKAEKEAVEAEELAREIGLRDTSDDGLKQLIMKRKTDRGAALDDMIAGLEAKYCKPKKARASKTKTGKSKK